MNIRAFVCQICEKCRVIHWRGRILAICYNPRHKQRQGQSFEKGLSNVKDSGNVRGTTPLFLTSLVIS